VASDGIISIPNFAYLKEHPKVLRNLLRNLATYTLAAAVKGMRKQAYYSTEVSQLCHIDHIKTVLQCTSW
jgi:hypothetical protein